MKYALEEATEEKMASSESVAAELRRLRRKNAFLKEDREIFKNPRWVQPIDAKTR